MTHRLLGSWVLGVLGLVVSLRGFADPVETGDIIHYSLKVDQPAWNKTRVVFKLENYQRAERSIAGAKFSQVALGQSSMTDERGFPELPKISQNIAIPCETVMDKGDSAIINAEKIDYHVQKKSHRMKTYPPVPSKGSIERDVNPEDVSWFFGDFYQHQPKGALYPLNFWSTSKPFILRDVCGINLTVFPFQYDFNKGELEVLTEMEWVLDVQGADSQSGFFRTQNQMKSELFEALYPVHFANMLSLSQMGEAETLKTIHDPGSILVITTASFLDSLKPWRGIKRQLGFESSVVLMEDISKNSERGWQAVKQAIQNAYHQDRRLAYVVIVGDAEIVPFHPGDAGNALGRPADPMYGLLEGNDSYPELIVGRISVKTKEELDLVLHKVMSYEFHPDPKADWYQKAMGIASREGDPTDAQRADWLRERLLSSSYSHVDRFYEPWVGTQELMEAFNEGRGFVNYTGHGSPKAWATGAFSRDHIDQLQNTSMFPVIVSVACVNGRFDYRFGDSFAERWLKAGSIQKPTGAVAVFASSTNQAWVPPTVGQKHITHLLTKGKSRSVGFLFASGAIAVLDDPSTDAEQTFQTWHIFGDPTLEVRTRRPEPIEAKIPEEISLTQDEGIKVDFVDSESSPVRAVITTDDRVVLTKTLGRTDSTIVFTSGELAGLTSTVTLTLSGSNRIPLTQVLKILE